MSLRGVVTGKPPLIPLDSNRQQFPDRLMRRPGERIGGDRCAVLDEVLKFVDRYGRYGTAASWWWVWANFRFSKAGLIDLSIFL